MKKFRLMPVCILACLAVVGCGSRDKTAPLTPEQNNAKTQLDAQIKAAAQTTQTYHAMDNPTLVQKLLEQSKAKREPFNSLAYRELKTRTNVDSKALVSLVKENGNADGLLPLLLLRKLDNKSYLEVPAELRARILTDALQSSKNFNTWGLPGFHLEDASQAMIEAGRSAEPALRKLLSDTRPAPVFGSQEYTIYQRYKFRVCDYALLYLEKLQGNAEYREAMTSTERDAAIKQLPTK